MTIRTTKPTKVPGLPKAPADISPGLRRYLESLSEAVEIRLGRRGDTRDRAVTLRELIDSGLAVEVANRPFDPNGGSNFTGDTEVADTTIPPAPTGFTVNGGYSVMLLFWDAPYDQYSNHSLTEVWRHDSNVLGDAQLVGVSSGFSFSDPCGEGQSFYYWIRYVNTNGIIGPYNSSTGTLGETALDVVNTLEVLQGAITESQLYSTLNSRIDLIEVNEAALAVVETNLATAETNLATAEADIAAAQLLINAAENDIVSLETITTTHTSQITNLNTTVGSNSSNITTLQQTTATNASDITALETTVNDPSTGVNATASGLSSLSTTVTQQGNDITTNASDITALETTVNNPTTGVAATASGLSNLSTTVTQQGNNISTNANDITALETTVNDPATGVTATAGGLSSLSATVTQQGNDITSNANDITSLETTVNDPTTGLVATRATLINNYYTETDTDSAIANATSTLVATSYLTANYSTTAAIQQNYFAKADGEDLEAQYTVKIDLDGNVAGFGLASTSSAAGASSQFLVAANRFAVVGPSTSGGPNNTPYVPFTVQATTQVINGETVQAGVYITDAYIKNGQITNLKIGDLAVDVAKIADLAVSEGKIDDLAVSTGKLQDGSITNAKIGNLQVTTLKIGDENVTVPRARSGPSGVSLGSGWTQVGTLTVNWGSDASLLPSEVQFFGQLNIVATSTGTNEVTRGLRIAAGSAEGIVGQSSLQGFSDCMSAGFVHTPSTGSTTYIIYGSSTGSGAIAGNWFISLLGCKK